MFINYTCLLCTIPCIPKLAAYIYSIFYCLNNFFVDVLLFIYLHATFALHVFYIMVLFFLFKLSGWK